MASLTEAGLSLPEAIEVAEEGSVTSFSTWTTDIAAPLLAAGPPPERATT